MKATFKKYLLHFKRPGGTSRGILTTKETWFLVLEQEGRLGVGECGLFRGLSYDDVPGYEEKCQWVADHIHLGLEPLLAKLMDFPSLQFGLEQAFLSLQSQHPFALFDSPFLREGAPIPINGLIWMGDTGFMKSQIDEKLEQGFSCLKLKIGALDFMEELRLLEAIRSNFSPEEIELRVDANGAFAPGDALGKLKELAPYQLHSIEQPIPQGHWESMKALCAASPLPIALDEELIGIAHVTQKEELLKMVQPQYIILKPSLVGGFGGSQEWINLAEKYTIGWWVTSALESNIGLNAIAQWTATLGNKMPQGLGTGALFSNNVESPLHVAQGGLYYKRAKEWNMELINEICI
jgi:o-succinylbenzoate synthase